MNVSPCTASGHCHCDHQLKLLQSMNYIMLRGVFHIRVRLARTSKCNVKPSAECIASASASDAAQRLYLQSPLMFGRARESVAAHSRHLNLYRFHSPNPSTLFFSPPGPHLLIPSTHSCFDFQAAKCSLIVRTGTVRSMNRRLLNAE